MPRKYYNIRLLPLVFFCTVSLGTFLHFQGSYKAIFEHRERTWKEIRKYVTNPKINPYQECVMPIFEESDPNILLMLRDIRTEKCGSSKDWVEVDGSTVKISKWAKQNLRKIECSFTDILRKTEKLTYPGKTTTSQSEYILKESDVVKVMCTDSLKNAWHKVLLGVRSDEDILKRSSWSKVPQDSLKLNVLMIGIESMSHNMWKKKLTKTYEYATKSLGGIALNGYNIVGDGTLHSLLPILTGKTELELPETRKSRGSEAQFVDIYPFIWNDFKNNGYVTLYGEDHLSLQTFSARLKGFYEQPVDHYARPFYQITKPSSRERDFCYGELSKIQIMTEYIKNMYKVYKDKPKFMFIFYAEYTYDNLHLASNADQDLADFLKQFTNSGSLNNTLLILMSDHGSRNNYFRSTQQGKQEERLPGFIFIFPSWFKTKYANAYNNLKTNADRLTTPFDVHETLKNILHYEGTNENITRKRGMSLFKSVPFTRSCVDAEIEPKWCTCLDWEKLVLPNTLISEAANTVLKYINGLINKYSLICAKLRLKNILWSARMFPNESLLKFRFSTGKGVTKEVSGIVAVRTDIYRINLSLSPGDMKFDVFIVHQLFNNRFSIAERHIKRIDMNKQTGDCLNNKLVPRYLRKFCYCK